MLCFPSNPIKYTLEVNAFSLIHTHPTGTHTSPSKTPAPTLSSFISSSPASKDDNCLLRRIKIQVRNIFENASANRHEHAHTRLNTRKLEHPSTHLTSAAAETALDTPEEVDP